MKENSPFAVPAAGTWSHSTFTTSSGTVSTGAVVSTTVITWLAVLLLPQ